MAEHIVSLATGGDVRWFMLGLQARRSPKRLANHLRAAIQTFLLAYGTDATKLAC